jgi:hypothetical protein
MTRTEQAVVSRLRSHGARRAGIRCVTCRSSQASHACSFAFVCGRAERADVVGVDADGSVVLAEDNPRDVLGHVLWTSVSVEWDVRGALEVVRVLVEAHFCRMVLGPATMLDDDCYGRKVGSGEGGVFAMMLR